MSKIISIISLTASRKDSILKRVIEKLKENVENKLYKTINNIFANSNLCVIINIYKLERSWFFMVIKTINKNTGKIGMQIEVFNSKDMCYLKKMCPQNIINGLY